MRPIPNDRYNQINTQYGNVLKDLHDQKIKTLKSTFDSMQEVDLKPSDFYFDKTTLSLKVDKINLEQSFLKDITYSFLIKRSKKCLQTFEELVQKLASSSNPSKINEEIEENKKSYAHIISLANFVKNNEPNKVSISVFSTPTNIELQFYYNFIFNRTYHHATIIIPTAELKEFLSMIKEL